MNNQQILGMDSAYQQAKEDGLRNMQVSAPLIVELVERIVELEAQTQWVSVEDRLPDEKRDYLVYTPKSTYYKRGSNAWHGKLGWATAKNVTHWMPLPTPPSGGEL